MSELILTVCAYGPYERRVEIDMRPKIPPQVKDNLPQFNQWVQGLLLGLGADVKHTANWDCSMECGKPARETNFNMASWIHLPEPRVNVYVHHICSVGKRKCRRKLEEVNRDIARATGRPLPPGPAPPPLPRTQAEYPLSGSCAKCQKDETALPSCNLSRCSGCKLTRYCSVTCQREDWPRHKKACKAVKNVKWVNWP